MTHAKSRSNRLLLVFVVVLLNALAVKHPSCQLVGGIVDAIALVSPNFR